MLKKQFATGRASHEIYVIPSSQSANRDELWLLLTASYAFVDDNPERMI